MLLRRQLLSYFYRCVIPAGPTAGPPDHFRPRRHRRPPVGVIDTAARLVQPGVAEAESFVRPLFEFVLVALVLVAFAVIVL